MKGKSHHLLGFLAQTGNLKTFTFKVRGFPSISGYKPVIFLNYEVIGNKKIIDIKTGQLSLLHRLKTQRSF